MQTLIQDQTFNIQRDGGYRKKSHCDFFMTICTRESGIIFSEVGVAKCSSSARGDVWTAQSIWEVPITRRGVSTSPPIEPLRLCQHIRSHCLLNSLLSSFIWDRWKVTFRTTRVCKIKLKCKQDPSKFSKAISTMSLWVAGCWECGVWIPHACTCLPALEKRWGQAPKSFCQAKYQINIIMTAHSYFNSYFTRNHHDHINFVPNVLIIFISSVTTYRTPHISTEIPQVTIYHFYWIVLKLLPTLQSFFSDLVATLDIVIILCYLYYFSRLFYIF